MTAAMVVAPVPSAVPSPSGFLDPSYNFPLIMGMFPLSIHSCTHDEGPSRTAA